MKTVILAGGFGTRLAGYNDSIPKPMIPIGQMPILWHIMKRYADYGHKDFLLALGFKSEVIKSYFLNYKNANADCRVNLSTGLVETLGSSDEDWNVALVDTGLETMTGGRVRRMANFIGNEPFFLTYGDGLADIKIDELLEFHVSHGRMVTVTAVRPSARFGELELSGKKVERFTEKPQLGEGWINGGFFVVNPEFLEYIEGDGTLLEREPMEKAAEIGELMAFKHDGFWQCVDTKRDHELLQQIWRRGVVPWRR
jgi:glucose-1-phosphate cytidylyltransferase